MAKSLGFRSAISLQHTFESAQARAGPVSPFVWSTEFATAHIATPTKPFQAGQHCRLRVRIQGFKPKLFAFAVHSCYAVVRFGASLGCLRPSGSNRLNLVTDFAVHSLLALGRTAQVPSPFGPFPRRKAQIGTGELPKPQGFNRFNRCRHTNWFLEPQFLQGKSLCRQQNLKRRTTLVGFFSFCAFCDRRPCGQLQQTALSDRR